MRARRYLIQITVEQLCVILPTNGVLLRHVWRTGSCYISDICIPWKQYMPYYPYASAIYSLKSRGWPPDAFYAPKSMEHAKFQFCQSHTIALCVIISLFCCKQAQKLSNPIHTWVHSNLAHQDQPGDFRHSMASDITGVKPGATCLEASGLNMLKCKSHKAAIWLLK